MSSVRKVIEPELKLLGSGSAFQAQLLAMLQGSQFFGDFPAAEIETLAKYVQAYSACFRHRHIPRERPRRLYVSGDRRRCGNIQAGRQVRQQAHRPDRARQDHRRDGAGRRRAALGDLHLSAAIDTGNADARAVRAHHP